MVSTCTSWRGSLKNNFQTCMHMFVSQGFQYIDVCFIMVRSLLFNSTLDTKTSTRIMDLFLMDGVQVLFRLSLAMLQLSKSAILSLEMESMLKYFHEELPAKLKPSRPSLFSVRLFQVQQCKNEETG